MIYTMTRLHETRIVTSDKHFKDLEMVIYLEKPQQ
ncbi:hypothetical protein MOMUL_13140 [Moorella mulderi DSM 14980]|uniref:PIN domain-containing protein n=1 Tax=Moorella mulderi DSM 14980 TaxID=1122241 RepID=A0A151AYT7_9FIRM|nr:hypothetical protein MOMUL_13140 [Moorella mulderi DSM 14980]